MHNGEIIGLMHTNVLALLYGIYETVPKIELLNHYTFINYTWPGTLNVKQ